MIHIKRCRTCERLFDQGTNFEHCHECREGKKVCEKCGKFTGIFNYCRDCLYELNKVVKVDGCSI